MIDLTGIEKFETRGKTVHSHYDGREIQRTFHLLGDVIPGRTPPARYQKAPDVVEAMLGSVTREVEGDKWTRHFPAQDPEYPQCYCNEVKVRQIHPDAISKSPTLGLGNLAAETTPEARYAKFMQQVNGVQDNPAGGCFLTASYRPLMSAYRPSPSDPHESDGRIFDWIDPHFTPGVRTGPWPDGLQIATRTKAVSVWTPSVPDEVAQPVNIPITEFTIKRLLVGEVPYTLLDRLLNSVNDRSWPVPANQYTIPLFPKGTLRFDNYKVANHYSPASGGGLWYELVYHFSWMNLLDSPVFGEEGQLLDKGGYANVTWNHVLVRPAVPLTGGIVLKDLGWYFIMKIRYPDWQEAVGKGTVGPLFSFADLDPLFMLNPPH